MLNGDKTGSVTMGTIAGRHREKRWDFLGEEENAPRVALQHVFYVPIRVGAESAGQLAAATPEDSGEPSIDDETVSPATRNSSTRRSHIE